MSSNQESEEGSVRGSADFDILLAEAALGALDAQQALVDKYADEVRIVARVLLGPQLRQHFDSMDLVQSVHRSVLIGLRMERYQFSSPDKLIALACAILRRKVAKKWRHCRRQITVDLPKNADSPPVSKILSDLTNRETDPSLMAQFDDQLANLCRRLSESDRCMLEMRLDGFSNQEIAEALGIHPIALRVRWTRLRKRLSLAGVNQELI